MESLNNLLDRLTGKIYTDHGICLHAPMFRNYLKYLWKDWICFSGDMKYPVRTDNSITPKEEYHIHKNKWDKQTAYGRSRHDLLTYIINRTERFIEAEKVYQNQEKWIAFLAEPERVGIANKLEHITDNNMRCCLGHAAHLFIPEYRSIKNNKVYYGNEWSIADTPLRDRLGLFDDIGSFKDTSLAELNDMGKSPQEISAIIRSIVDEEDNPFTDSSNKYRKEREMIISLIPNT